MKRVLSIAGSDSGGGAGIQADLKTTLAHGVHGMSVVTAITAQSSVGVRATWEVPADVVRAQLDAVIADIGVDAVKTGMLASPEVVAAVAERLRGVRAPLVVDPVALSKHGDVLLSERALQVLRAELLPLAVLVTPNLDEVEQLAGVAVRREQELRAGAEAVLALGPRWVLVKGGHLDGDAVDLLTDGTDEHLLRAPRLANRHTHGTGCTLASAIASRLALGNDVVDAVRSAKDYVTGAIRAGYALGAGIGPVDHAWQHR